MSFSTPKKRTAGRWCSLRDFGGRSRTGDFVHHDAPVRSVNDVKCFSTRPQPSVYIFNSIVLVSPMAQLPHDWKGIEMANNNQSDNNQNGNNQGGRGQGSNASDGNNRTSNSQGGNSQSERAGSQGNENEGRGFAGMDSEEQRAIAAKGGRAAHASGNAHEFTSEEAREAGRKGGEASRGGQSNERDNAESSSRGNSGSDR